MDNLREPRRGLPRHTRMNKPLRKYVVPLLAAGLIAITGCSSGDTDSDSGSFSSSGQADRDSAGATQDLAEMPQEQATEGAAPESRPGGGSSDDSGARNRTAAQTRAVINTGTISLHSDDVEQARFDIQKVLDKLGGTISEEDTDTDTDGELERSRLVVRVPAADFDAAMTQIGEVAELVEANRKSEDVTTAVIDNEVRIRAQEKSLKRIEALLARATSIEDIVSIEQQLSNRQAELDSLKAQQKYLADQSSLSTVTVHLEQSDAEVEEKKDEEEHNAFVSGLLDGWDGLTGIGAGLATTVGVLLPFVAVVGVLAVPAWLLARNLRRNRRRPAATVAD